MDVIILTFFVSFGIGISRAEIGAYENAWRVSLVVILFSQAVSTVLFPQFSKWDSEGALHKIESAIPRALLPSLLLVIPAFVGTTVLSKDILSILFGEEFVVAWVALIILTGERYSSLYMFSLVALLQLLIGLIWPPMPQSLQYR